MTLHFLQQTLPCKLCTLCWRYPPHHHSLLVDYMVVQDNYTGQNVRQPPELS